MNGKDTATTEVLDADEETLYYSGFHDLSDTQTIDLRHLIDELDLSPQVSFRELEGTVLGKFLQSIPIPILLIDRSSTIIFANQYWEKISENYGDIVNQPFFCIFAKQSVVEAVRSIVDRGFTTRKPLVASALLEIGRSIIWGRMHFRSLRMGSEGALIVLVEDLTNEKKQLFATEKHKEALVQAHMQLEQRVKERTAELDAMNQSLRLEIGFRKRAERSLSVSRASFTSIVEKTSEGILVVDPENTVLYANPAAESLLGRPRDRLIGQYFGLKVLPGQIKEIRGKRLSGESGILELRVESTDWNASPANLLMLRDITERKRAEQEMLKAEKLESLELIAGGIAHDFNNLLTGTIANISLAKMDATGGSNQYQALRNAEKAAAGAKHLTHRLLTFTKGGEPVKRPTSVDRIIKDGLALALSGSKVKHELFLPRDLWVANIDDQQIGQAFQNLFINSVQAMPNGGTLTVRVENFSGEHHLVRSMNLGDKYVKISITDTGCGIAPKNLGKIFDPYFTTKPRGSGIGLATTYSVIRRHGGIIDVESEVNTGTTFFVYLPASFEIDAELHPTESGETPIWGTGRVLVMDDDDAIRMVAMDLLTLLGYQVAVAKDGSECIEMYKEAMDAGKPFCALIMDLTVPGGMGGKAAIERLRVIDPDVKAIVSSGYSTDPVMSNHESYGFKGIVAKPYNAVELSRALHELIAGKRIGRG
jgi:two-component system, cell cycle sensor histidine kinase and response regulator CckA